MAKTLWLLEIMLERRTFLPITQYVPVYASDETDALQQAREWSKKSGRAVEKVVEQTCGFTLYHAHLPGSMKVSVSSNGSKKQQNFVPLHSLPDMCHFTRITLKRSSDFAILQFCPRELTSRARGAIILPVNALCLTAIALVLVSFVHQNREMVV